MQKQQQAAKESTKLHENQEEITPQTIQQFNKVCQQATQLMLSYKQQSQDLKHQITSMVNVYNKNANPNQAVPIEKIVQITNVYETQMKNAHNQYEHLEDLLRKQQGERDDMMKEIGKCFEKLQRMEKILAEKKNKQIKTQQVKNTQQNSKTLIKQN